MKPTRWLMLLLVSVSLFGAACGGADPDLEEVAPTEEVSPDELNEDETGEVEEEDEDAEEGDEN